MNKAIVVIPLLAIAALALPGANAQAAPPGGGASGADPADHAGGDYVELLKQQEAFLNMTEAEQRVYVQRAVDFINSDDPYESARNKLLQELSTATLELQRTADVEEKRQIQDRIDGILGQLEGLGVASADKMEGNEQFYIDRYAEAKERLDNAGNEPEWGIDVDYDYVGTAGAGPDSKAAAYLHALLQPLAIQARVLLEHAVVALGQLTHALGLSPPAGP